MFDFFLCFVSLLPLSPRSNLHFFSMAGLEVYLPRLAVHTELKVLRVSYPEECYVNEDWLDKSVAKTRLLKVMEARVPPVELVLCNLTRGYG